MNYKHVQVVIEELQYSRSIDAQDAINDICDYIKWLEDGDVQGHYEHCILDKGKDES